MRQTCTNCHGTGFADAPQVTGIYASKSATTRISELEAINADVLAALETIAQKWPLAFQALAPGLKQMTSAEEVRSVNDFDQTIVEARAAIAKAK